jgi:hypothetical protein
MIMMIMWRRRRRRKRKYSKKEVVRRNKNSTEVDVAILTRVRSFCYGKLSLENKISYIAVKKETVFDCFDAQAQTFVHTKHCPHNRSVCTKIPLRFTHFQRHLRLGK